MNADCPDIEGARSGPQTKDHHTGGGLVASIPGFSKHMHHRQRMGTRGEGRGDVVFLLLKTD